MSHYQRSGPWLAELFRKAAERRWCVKPYCTTCGSTEFRTSYLTEARRRAGVSAPARSSASRRRRPWDLIDELTAEERDATLSELASAVKELPLEATHSDAFRLVCMELEAMPLGWCAADSLGSLLAGSPAGEALSEMVRHSQEVERQRVLRTEWERPEAVAERRARAARESAERHAAVLREQAERNQRRLDLIGELSDKAPVERLAWLAAQPVDFPLDSLPAELITKDLGAQSVSWSVARNVVQRIGKRRGAWKRVRELLETLSGGRGPEGFMS